MECGLKFLLLKTRNLTTCPKERGNLLYSHDLVGILRELKPSRAEVGTAPSRLRLDLKSGKKKHQGVGDVHLVWRYGLPINPKNEEEIVNWLRKVSEYIALKRRRT